ncbi:stage II sporulation protein R [Lottiidibacillus patelloidae]|uniref:Stage II sporulation protein R n=1 Tax=Lottiidibacillus patelloidae TaxID=2670334 RepID=A0A263BSS9_9BACI|nr:stage II sporulation protein R [Lottiidibacillus patelloidae]OZM56773.1 stage II sporulation protein R [Lottiidibacillus patelloidae]
MKQKISIVLYIILSLVIVSIDAAQGQQVANADNNPTVIPEEAIRLRILANSNGETDQNLKKEIRNAVNYEISNWVANLSNVDNARQIIKENLPEIEEIVSQKLNQFGMYQSFSVAFKEVSFPTKMYGKYIYPAGTYEAVVITLGDGQGANWWCVLFPPLCFLDFSNGDAVETANEQPTEVVAQGGDVEVKFFVAEIFAKIAAFIKSII